MKYVGFVLFSVFGAFCAYWGVVFLSRGEFMTALAVLAVGVSWFGLVAIGIRTSRRTVTARTEFDAVGTTIRPDRVVDLLSRSVLASGTAAATLFAVLAPVGLLAIPIPRVQRYALPVGAAIVALIGATMLWRTIRQGSLSYMRLTTSGFEFGGGLSAMRGDWSAVKAVTDTRPGARNLTASAIIVKLSDRKVCTVASTGSYTADENALRDMVAFYWRHPEARSELTDGAASARLSPSGFRGS
ncbi:hypothetical protein [Mycobacterium sp. AZCC_0083]|uniref:hypothetical protein n=1 Tax=Mycobacterium sp. AZCC_0083 TaxID=2735882 RepID=UPI001619794B|nr:hypothetical protein [Mycobacterium sp. AZCC_0083]MBB5164143.1 hypothetical protein [Mycobacterium sp. AZCC_0083]